MNSVIKRIFAVICILTLTLSMTGCNLMGNTKKTYSAYVQSLLDANYKADFSQYLTITGVTEAEAEQVYNDGIVYLAEALMSAYGVNDVEGSDIKAQFMELAKEIYQHASYEITNVDKTDGIYYVTVTIYPIDILLITYDDTVQYIQSMNEKVTAGDYNDYELDDYEIEYAQGIIQILTDALPNIGNEEGTEITVTILDNGEYYYISDADFIALDKAILATVTVNEEGNVENPNDTADTTAEPDIE